MSDNKLHIIIPGIAGIISIIGIIILSVLGIAIPQSLVGITGTFILWAFGGTIKNVSNKDGQ